MWLLFALSMWAHHYHHCPCLVSDVSSNILGIICCVKGFSSLIRPSTTQDSQDTTDQNLQELKGLEALLPECLGQNSWLADFNVNDNSKSKHGKLGEGFALLRLRSRISSYLDVPGLCAERATAPESFSRKACASALCRVI